MNLLYEAIKAHDFPNLKFFIDQNREIKDIAGDVYIYLQYLRKQQQKLFVQMNKFQKRLQFLKQFSQLYFHIRRFNSDLNRLLREIQHSLKSEDIQINRAKLTIDLEKIVIKGIQVDNRSNFLLQNWDIDFLQKLYQANVSIEGIYKIKDQNIRQNILPQVTEQQLQPLGLKLGDFIILKQFK